MPHGTTSMESAGPAAAAAAAASETRSVRQAAQRYRTSSLRRGALQLATTLLPLAALLWLMHASLRYPYALTLLIAIPAAGFLVRTFIIMHDCAHGSFTPSARVNEVVGFITGALTLTPFGQWRRDHALHHASSGDLDRRGHGDIITLTVDEYRARDAWGRFKYRLYRNPVILFGFGPLYLLAKQRWLAGGISAPGSAAERKQWRSVHATNATIAAAAVVASLLIGVKALALVYLPVILLAASAGIWLFYVQHQFEDAYWEPHSEWEYDTAALHGSSYYRLPRVLEWMTGSIGLHHVHHTDPRIPNYNLRRCHEENPGFHRVTQLTLRESLRTASLKLWDPEQGRMVGFEAAEKTEQAERAEK